MQEDINHRSITFGVNSSKMTGKLLLKLIKLYLTHKKELPHGKQTIKQLAKHCQGMTNIEIKDNDAILSAFKEFTADRMRKVEKPSVLQELREEKEKIKNAVVEKVKKKEQVR